MTMTCLKTVVVINKCMHPVLNLCSNESYLFWQFDIMNVIRLHKLDIYCAILILCGC